MMRFDIRPGIRRFFRLPLRTASSIYADVDEELESIMAARVDDLMSRGLSRADARSEALRRLGTTFESARDDLHHSAQRRERHMRFHEYWDDLTHDVRYAARGLVRRPAFTFVAVLTLAIGIGATTAIFSAVNVLLLRPLPYSQPDELMRVTLVTPGHGTRPGTDQMVWSYPKYRVFRREQRVFSQTALYSDWQFTVTGGDVERLAGEYVGATLLRTLGVSPIRGRDFDRNVDDHTGAAREAILSYRLWQRRFNADPAVIGRTVDLDGAAHTIVGVTPRGFSGLSGQAELFVPITTRPNDDLEQPQSHEFWMVARRAHGVSAAGAMAAVTVLGGRVNDAVPNRMDNARWGAKAEPLNNARLDPSIRRSLLVLFGAVGLVLLIACVNVANLLLGRAAVRRREIAVRLAIGAGRSRLVRLLLTESVLLALAGAAASIVVAWIGVRALGTINPATTLRMTRENGLGAVAFSSITLDWMALAFTFGVSLMVGVLFGMAPALNAARASLADALKGAPTTSEDGAARHASAGRRMLVVAEVALALMLLAGSGLMIRSLAKLLSTDVGFDAANVLTVRLTVADAVAMDSSPGFYVQLLDRIRAVPGVVDASLNNCPPLNGGCSGTIIRRLDRPLVDFAHSPNVGVHWASPSWFSTLRIPLRSGRGFTDADRTGAPKVMVVNEQAARAFWPGENPVGKHAEIGMGGMKDAEVIGVVGGVRQTPDSQPRPEVYVSYYQSPRPGMIIYVRTQRDPAAAGAEIRRAVHEVAPHYPIYDMKTMAERAAGATAQARFSAALLGLFALTALSLAAVGIYGVMSLAVAARTKEIGIRIALGSGQRRVLRLVMREGISLAAAGAAIGVVGALVATRVLRTLLFDVAPSDPAMYAAIVLVLGAAAVTASWIPARRASRVDPVVALRQE